MDHKWVISGRYVDTLLERPRWRFTLHHRVWRTLQLGVEYNAAAAEVGPLLNWYVLTEGHWLPVVMLGTSSDRIGSPAGRQSYFLTVAKNIPRTPLAPYVSLNYSEWDRGFNLPLGANLALPYGLAVRPMYDGHRSHLLLSLQQRQLHLSLLYIWFERLGLAVAVGF